MTDEQNVSNDSSESGPERVDVVADDLETLQQEIQLRAYYCYCERGAPGADVDDWLATERPAGPRTAVSRFLRRS